MKHHRPIGIALVAAMCFLAFAATAAASQFRGESYPTAVTGSQTTSLAIATQTGKITCNSTSYTGSLPAASSSLTISPTNSGCKAFGFANATVKMNSCSYVVRSTNEAAPLTGTFGASCSQEGDGIEITQPYVNCKITVPAQTELASLSLENSGLNNHRAVKVTQNVTGLKYVETGSACTAAGTHTDGKFTGAFTLGGTSGGSQAGLYVAGEQIAAGPTQLRAESYPVQFDTDSVQQFFTLGGVKMNCTSFHGARQASAASADLSLEGTWSGCTYFGSKFAISANGCSPTLHINSSSYATASASFGISCGKAGAAMSFTYPGTNCEVKIPAQSGLGGVTLTGLGSGISRTLGMVQAVTGLTYSQSGSACVSSGTFSNGQVSGEGTIAAYKVTSGVKGVQQGTWIE